MASRRCNAHRRVEQVQARAAPVGYDPAIIPVWTSPTADTFAALRLEPWRLRVFPGTALMSGGAIGDILTWQLEPSTGALARND